VANASIVGTNGATLNGVVIANGLSTNAWFEYGTDPTLTIKSSTAQQTIGSGMNAVTISTSVTGLAENTKFYFRVCASNVKGNSYSSIISFVTSSPGLPPIVTTLAATSVGANTATLNGNVTANGLETTAWFEWGTDPSLASPNSTSTQAVGAGTTSQSVNAVLTGLTSGTTYYYRIAASNSTGPTRGSIASFIPGDAPTITTLAATPVGANSATLNGNVTPNGLSTNAWFEWGTDPSLATFTYTQMQSIGAGTNVQSINTALTGLSNQTMYYYRVAASNISGTNRGSIASFITGAVPTVATLAASSIGKSTATLNGTVNPNGLSTNIWFEWGTDPTLSTYSSTTMQSTGSGSTTQSAEKVLTGLTTGTTYYYRAVASNSAGMIQGSIVNFLPHEPGKFAGPFLLERNDFKFSESPQVSVDKLGNAIVVWSQSDGTRSFVYYNRYSVSSNTWTGAIRLGPDQINAYDPRVSMDTNGNAMIIWRHPYGTGSSLYEGIWAVRYTAFSQTFGNPIQIFYQNVGSPLIAIGLDGRAITAWKYANTIVINWYSAFPEQFWVKKTFVVSDNTASSHRIAMDKDGNAVVVWKQSDGIRYNIWANQFSSTTQNWSSPTLIEFNDAGDVSDPYLAMNETGNALAVWEQSDNVIINIWANRFTAATQTWSEPVLLETTLSSGSGSIRFGAPHASIDVVGNVMVVWNTFWDVRVGKFSQSTQEWTNTVISDNTLGPIIVDHPLVAMGVDGNAAVVWTVLGIGAHNDLYARRFSATTNAWLDIDKLEFSSTVDGIDLSADVSSCQVEVDGMNNALVVWTQRVDTINYDVWFNRTY
jgi:phosphodiesterase/alkaline phosphatase D-like protein